MIRLTPGTDWAALTRQLLDDSDRNATQIAEATGIHVSQIHHWCRGGKVPGRASLVRLLPALGYDLALVKREEACR